MTGKSCHFWGCSDDYVMVTDLHYVHILQIISDGRFWRRFNMRLHGQARFAAIQRGLVRILYIIRPVVFFFFFFVCVCVCVTSFE